MAWMNSCLTSCWLFCDTMGSLPSKEPYTKKSWGGVTTEECVPNARASNQPSTRDESDDMCYDFNECKRWGLLWVGCRWPNWASGGLQSTWRKRSFYESYERHEWSHAGTTNRHGCQPSIVCRPSPGQWLIDTIESRVTYRFKSCWPVRGAKMIFAGVLDAQLVCACLHWFTVTICDLNFALHALQRKDLQYFEQHLIQTEFFQS
jgi:hypothetical protein